MASMKSRSRPSHDAKLHMLAGPFCFIIKKLTKMKKLNFLIATFVFVSANIFAQTEIKVDLKQLEKYYTKMVIDWDIPGVSIGIVKDGRMIFSGNYGVVEEGKKIKPDENTLFAIASNSKAFTSAIIGMLVQEGKLDWNDKVKKYLPYFELYDPWVSNEVTVRDILSHRVGLAEYSGDLTWYKSDLTAEEIIQRAKYLPKAYDFRSGYGYSNLMYITAGELIKEITGKSWSDNVKERIFEPLGMNRTITTPTKLEAVGNYATPHMRENDKNIPIAWEDCETIAASGGIISSVHDVAKWMIFNLNHGIHGQDTLLSKQTRNLVWTMHNVSVVDQTSKNDLERRFSGYGLGWNIGDFYGNFMVGHTGGADGMITAVTLIPDRKLGVVVLTNGHKSPIMAATYYALDKFLGLDTKDWSKEFLEEANDKQKNDFRISNRKKSRVLNTKPSLPLVKYIGIYKSDINGEIKITQEGEQLRMEFEHSPDLAATLRHWHYDVWEIIWDKKHAWFSFGTIKFITDNNMEVKGIHFDVPADDWNDTLIFDELKPYKINAVVNKK